ncbi:MAG: GNAT family N-acetyltransferase [Candidatus Delongbacteria bacterium]|nr:GNAT family N-acetyltransferase [Candidatus Delongbacteria bacterium]
MRYFKKLVGEKCYLSPINIDDHEQYTEWLNDLEITSNLGASRGVIALNTEREYLEKLSREHNYAIIDKETDTLIGNCGFHKIDTISRNAEIGIFIGNKDFWDRGYGTDAMKQLMKYGFDHLNFRNIMLKVFSFNERAMASYRKCGFKEIGRRRNSILMYGKEYDDVMMDILDDEFRKLINN